MKLLNGFGTDPAYYIVPSYSIVKGKRNFCSHGRSRLVSPSPNLTTIVEPTSATTMEMENATAVPAAACAAPGS
jgi:hypothetical protein